ncbi:hypothetical protein COT47_00860, partial [Candidatus Woesearchaeota archaeon CG08_land_8_20_14_0_20_43_7]
MLKVNNMLQQLEDLLKKLETGTRSAEEITHRPTLMPMEFRPYEMTWENRYQNPTMNSLIEIRFDNNYDVIAYSEIVQGKKTTFTHSEIRNLKGTGILTNYVRHDPRYVLVNCKDDRQIASGVFEVIIYDDDAKEMEDEADDMAQIMGNMAYIEFHAQFYLDDNDDLKKFTIVKKYPKLKKESLFTEIIFS